MQFLANENVPLKSVYLLREAGHDVAAIIEDSPGVKDEEVLKRAAEEQRIILTFDRDYGELIYKRKLTVPTGVVYFRFIPVSPEETAYYLLKLLTMDELSLEGRFTIFARERIRQRPLP
jgi:predicted nuclease of predicted toxin-antitoxin system